MKELQFAWDSEKDLTNQKKHGVSFEEAKTVFFDENARLIHDPDHSDEENRYLILGFSTRLNLLIVCHCYKEEETGETIRIISARKATRKETLQYGQGR